MNFTWDPIKAEQNLKKHGISFEEAKSCFFDPLHVVIDDPDHSSSSDERMILMGMSQEMRILVVVHVDIESRDEVRIISARKATRGEQKAYEDLP